ncbi:MAG: hypothetical protein ACOX58_00095 [Christensenellales bacterium]|jgi:hypothetical protein
MGRKPKYPDAEQVISSFYAAVSDSFNSPVSPDEVGQGGKKKQELIAEEFGISRLKVRKILITTHDLSYPLTTTISSLLAEGKSVGEICSKLRMSKSTVNSLIPYTKGAYKLSEVSAAAERTQIYRQRKAAISSLHAVVQTGSVEEQRVALWQCVVAFQGYPFTTSGRGKREGAKFKYEVSTPGGAGGRKYDGQSVEGFGNELFIIPASGEEKGEKRDKSITRSSVDYALKIVLEYRERGDEVTGPKALKVYGSSYVYSLFKRFGLISAPLKTDEK